MSKIYLTGPNTRKLHRPAEAKGRTICGIRCTPYWRSWTIPRVGSLSHKCARCAS